VRSSRLGRVRNSIGHSVMRCCPRGQSGATLQSSAAGSIPTAGTSDQSQPGPAEHQPRAPLLAAS
jgi:hypothetical protein